MIDHERPFVERQCPLVVPLSGELDQASPTLERLRSVVDGGSQAIVLDLSAVTFMDCAGLGQLLTAHAEFGDRMTLVNCSEAVTAILRLTGADDTLRPASDGTRGGAGGR